MATAEARGGEPKAIGALVQLPTKSETTLSWSEEERFEYQRDVRMMREDFPRALRGQTLGTFDPKPDAEALTVAGEFVRVCERWFENGRPDEPPGPVVFFSSRRAGEDVAPGNGKSRLAVGILEALAADGFLRMYRHERTGEAWPNLMFVSTPDLIAEIRACYSPSSARTVDEVVGRYLGADVLVLDDVGTEPDKDDATSHMYRILEKRRKPIIITSNYSTQRLRERTPEWAKVVSRMRERMRGAVLTGPDRREPQGDPWAAWR